MNRCVANQDTSPKRPIKSCPTTWADNHIFELPQCNKGLVTQENTDGELTFNAV